MTKGLEGVRALMAGAVDVDLPEDLVLPDTVEASPETPGHDAPPPPPRTPDDEDGDLPPAARCVDLPLNDYGNGQRLLVHYGEDLVHVSRVGWFIWDGWRFVADPDGIAVRRRAHNLTELIGQETFFLPMPDDEADTLAEAEETREELRTLEKIARSERSDDQSERLYVLQQLQGRAREIKDKRDKSVGRRLTHAKNAGNTNTIKNLMTEGGAIIARPLEDLDRNPLIINTEGGVLRFSTEPGEDDGGMYDPPPIVRVDRLDHDRAQLLSKVMPVGLDPQAKSPLFDAFLERIQPIAEMRRFLQRWFGYSMTGLTNEQKFAFFYGSGANGKSVLVDLIAKLMGDYAASAKIESITGRSRRGGGDATPDLVPLIGARFVRTSEPDDGQRLQEGLIKELTGGEPILVRALNENFVQVYPIFKLTISGNHKPEIHGGDDGIWRRVMLVPFDVQIPPEERDPELGAKLWAERDGILNWLIAGLRDYLAHGLQVPDQVLAATAEYRDDSDPLATFLTSCCGVTGETAHAMRSKDLGDAFAFWLDETGQGAWTPRTIYKRLKAKAGKWKHPATGQTFNARKSSDPFYDGISLISPFAGRFEDHQSARQLSNLRRDIGDVD
ncbi:phage/plasmid primase, P4 family [Cereibacter sphaeroides]|nr:phage/plasmid primase, P4 family [Cereibacter sphaeroides]